jgi:amino acid transporter
VNARVYKDIDRHAFRLNFIPKTSNYMQPTRDTRQLNWFLASAVVFCDIGTSVYYVPGILYGNVGDNTPFFILLTNLAFIPLAFKYIEITWRNPEGGGVVTNSTKAFGPMWGCLGGILITTSYFLTAAISAVSGFHHVGSVLPFLDAHIVPFACAALLALAILNIIGIRESATVALVMAATRSSPTSPSSLSQSNLCPSMNGTKLGKLYCPAMTCPFTVC